MSYLIACNKRGFFSSFWLYAAVSGHHPDLHLVGWNNVKIDIWTHSVGKMIIGLRFPISILYTRTPTRTNRHTHTHSHTDAMRKYSCFFHSFPVVLWLNDILGQFKCFWTSLYGQYFLCLLLLLLLRKYRLWGQFRKHLVATHVTVHPERREEIDCSPVGPTSYTGWMSVSLPCLCASCPGDGGAALDFGSRGVASPTSPTFSRTVRKYLALPVCLSLMDGLLHILSQG